MQRDFSAGGIIFKEDDEGLKFLLVNIYKKDKDVNYWGFPKGHPNVGESVKDAALREVTEETGVEVEIIEKVGDSKYFFYMEGEKVMKTVAFFLMRYKAGELHYQESELSGAEWVAAKVAKEKITFQNEKELFEKALEILNG